MRQATHAYLKPLLGVTLLYLVFECAFNAELLDVASSAVASSEDIDSIEVYGRFISGFACALAVCGSILFPWMHRYKVANNAYLPMAILLGIPIIFGVYYGEKRLIDYLAETSTAEERRDALLVSTANFLYK